MKLKTCSFCKEDKMLWKANPKACKECWAKFKASGSSSKDKSYNVVQKDKSVLKRINSVSSKKILELAKYRIVRDQYLKDHPVCEFYTCDCREVELHHKKSRKYYLSDVSIFMSVCREHHNWIHENDAKARELGYLLSSLET